MEKIAIIMPVYRSNRIIKRAFEMIKNQTMRNNIVLYFINDCSPNTDCEYQDIIQEYSKYIDIKYFKTNERSGPGVARQIALNQLQEKYFIFHDDDDYFYDQYAIENCIKVVEENKNKKISAIGFSYVDEFENNRTFFNLTNMGLWSHQSCLYYTDFFNKYNINQSEKTSFLDENIFFNYLVPFFSELNNYEILLYENITLKVFHHDRTYASVTFVIDERIEEKKEINLRKFLYNVNEMADRIFMYKNIICKYKKLDNDDKKQIILILKSFYKHSNNILYMIEKEKQCIFSKKEIKNFEESCNFLIDLIEKNLGTIENLINKERDEWDIPYEQIVFNYFKETYQLRCQELLKKCQI